jgi:hypothetical protein
MQRILVLATVLLAPALGGALSVQPAEPLRKVCSGIEPARWRFVTPVPNGWGPEDCRAYVNEIRAKEMQLGCVFDDPQADGRRFSFGPPLTAANLKARIDVPGANCGW